MRAGGSLSSPVVSPLASSHLGVIVFPHPARDLVAAQVEGLEIDARHLELLWGAWREREERDRAVRSAGPMVFCQGCTTGPAGTPRMPAPGPRQREARSPCPHRDTQGRGEYRGCACDAATHGTNEEKHARSSRPPPHLARRVLGRLVLGQALVFQHVHQGGLARIVQALEKWVGWCG